MNRKDDLSSDYYLYTLGADEAPTITFSPLEDEGDVFLPFDCCTSAELPILEYEICSDVFASKLDAEDKTTLALYIKTFKEGLDPSCMINKLKDKVQSISKHIQMEDDYADPNELAGCFRFVGAIEKSTTDFTETKLALHKELIRLLAYGTLPEKNVLISHLSTAHKEHFTRVQKAISKLPRTISDRPSVKAMIDDLKPTFEMNKQSPVRSKAMDRAQERTPAHFEPKG